MGKAYTEDTVVATSLSKSGEMFKPKVQSFRFNVRVLLVGLFIFVLIASMVQPSSAGRNRGRNPRRKQNSPGRGSDATSSASERGNADANPADGAEAGDATSRSSRRSRKHKKNHNILKTSAKAKTITERKYLKRDWCKSQPVRQYIRTADGCKGELINQFCYGQCNSFYIPKDIEIDERDGEIETDYFRFCAFCKPKTEEWISVRLRCRRKGRKKRGRYVIKRVKRVKGCTCISVPEQRMMLTAAPTVIGETVANTNSTAASESR
ncbi:DAN protein [Ciona intestinalis]